MEFINAKLLIIRVLFNIYELSRRYETIDVPKNIIEWYLNYLKQTSKFI